MKQDLQVLRPFRGWLGRVINMSAGRRSNNEYQSVGLGQNGPNLNESNSYQTQKAGTRLLPSARGVPPPKERDP
jgi:hypothetical protein